MNEKWQDFHILMLAREGLEQERVGMYIIEGTRGTKSFKKNK